MFREIQKYLTGKIFSGKNAVFAVKKYSSIWISRNTICFTPLKFRPQNFRGILRYINMHCIQGSIHDVRSDLEVI